MTKSEALDKYPDVTKYPWRFYCPCGKGYYTWKMGMGWVVGVLCLECQAQIWGLV